MAFKPNVRETERDSQADSLNRDDQTRVQRIRAGDVIAFEQLYRDYWSQLYNFAFRYVQSSEEAEDVVQEVFFAIWKGRAEWHITSSLQHYLLCRCEMLQSVASAGMQQCSAGDNAQLERMMRDRRKPPMRS